MRLVMKREFFLSLFTCVKVFVWSGLDKFLRLKTESINRNPLRIIRHKRFKCKKLINIDLQIHFSNKKLDVTTHKKLIFNHSITFKQEKH